MSHTVFHRHGVPARALSMLLLAAMLILAVDAAALEMESLYTVRVALDPDDPEAREYAYQSALQQVLVRLTGVADADGSAQLAELFPNPQRYVLQFRPLADNALQVSLDGAAIESVLRQAGQTIWGRDRPLTLVWLAVDWGQGEREIVAAEDQARIAGASRSIDRNRLLRERLQEAADRRGLPIVFPLLDTEDLQNISFSDIWGGFDQRLLQAAGRYGAASVLVGRVRPGVGQRNRWSYYFGDLQRQWSGEPEQAIDLLADTLVAEFAVDSNMPPETVTLNISGVDSLPAYGEVQNLMEELGQVENFTLRSVTGDRVSYVVMVRGGAERLSRALELSGVLQPVTGIGSGIDPLQLPQFDILDFVYRPQR
ncbi:MAG: DUF2066 domain-containing protein [Gammaproteobacteria bacterium]|nr:MAG: DUF2066 domain-containing protein [Gammaproteobacteria bacterium]